MSVQKAYWKDICGAGTGELKMTLKVADRMKDFEEGIFQVLKKRRSGEKRKKGVQPFRGNARFSHGASCDRGRGGGRKKARQLQIRAENASRAYTGGN